MQPTGVPDISTRGDDATEQIPMRKLMKIGHRRLDQFCEATFATPYRSWIRPASVGWNPQARK